MDNLNLRYLLTRYLSLNILSTMKAVGFDVRDNEVFLYFFLYNVDEESEEFIDDVVYESSQELGKQVKFKILDCLELNDFRDKLEMIYIFKD